MNKRPSFLQFASPWNFDLGTVRLLAPPEGLSKEEAIRRFLEGRLEQPYIVDTPWERRLHFSHHSVQSVMKLDEPDALVTAYTRRMMAFLLFSPEPTSITMVGLGGGSLAKFCYRHLPETQITAVEIDARVVALRDEFFIPADDDRFRIVCEDGAHHMSKVSGQSDVILIDAFDPVGLAPTLATSDFYVHAAERLSPEGVLVMNFSGEPSRYAIHIERIRAAFGGSALLVPVADENSLLFAFKRRIPLPTMAQYESLAQRLQSRLSLEFPRYLRRICQGKVLA